MFTYALLATMTLPPVDGQFLDLVKPADDVLAFNTYNGALYFLNIPAITPVANPSAPAPVYSLPQTPGVAVMDLAIEDLVYNSSQDRLYASVPGTEGVLANTIVAIDPGQAAVTAAYAAGPNPQQLAISGDGSEVYFSMGLVNNGVEYIGPGLRRIDLGAGNISNEFAQAPNFGNIQNIPDFTVLPGEPNSVAVLFGIMTVSVFDGANQRPQTLNMPYLCSSLQAGADATRLYCYDGNISPSKFSRLAVSSSGVTLVDTAATDPIGGGGRILFNGGRIYATNGKIIDPESYQVIATVPASGQVAVDGGTVYYLGAGSSSNTLTRQAFDTTTFAPLFTKTINIGAPPPGQYAPVASTRLVACGQGRLAFGWGNQTFVIYPSDGAPAAPSVTPNGLTNAASGASGAAEGSLVSLYGPNIVPDGVSASAPSLPLPTELHGVSVSVGGVQVPILVVAGANGQGQINFQMPYGLAGHGSLPLVVDSSGILSAPIQIQVLSAQPGVFLINGSGAVFHANYTQVTSNSPASEAEPLIVYCTGLGAVSPTAQTGAPAQGSPLAQSATPQATIGGIQAQVLFAGLAPAFAGLYQVNIVAPAGLAAGSSQLVITAGGAASVPAPVFFH